MRKLPRVIALIVFLFCCFGFKETGTTKYGNKTIEYPDGKTGFLVPKETFGLLVDCNIKIGDTGELKYIEESVMSICYFTGNDKYAVKTIIDDVDKDGKNDFIVHYSPHKVPGRQTYLTYEQAWEYSLISTALISYKTSWPSGKLYLIYSTWAGRHYDWAYTKDCRECLKQPNTYMARNCSVSSRKEITNKELQETLNKLFGM